jgi:S1-C subfamily serine protease
VSDKAAETSNPTQSRFLGNAFLLFLLAFLYWAGYRNLTGGGTRANPADTSPNQAIERPAELLPSADAVFSRSSPAVVQIVADSDQDIRICGSGFLINSRGLIATNYHVIENARNVHLVLADKTEMPVLGAVALDENADLAILEANGRIDAQPLELAGLDFPPIGSKAYTIGSPLGDFSNTFGEGIVSGLRNRGDVPHLPKMPTMIQMTTATSKGSSGGPLLGADGKVLGMVTLRFASEGGENLNLAVPASHVASLVHTCEKKLQVRRFPLKKAHKSEIHVPKQALSQTEKGDGDWRNTPLP